MSFLIPILLKCFGSKPLVNSVNNSISINGSAGNNSPVYVFLSGDGSPFGGAREAAGRVVGPAAGGDQAVASREAAAYQRAEPRSMLSTERTPRQ